VSNPYQAPRTSLRRDSSRGFPPVVRSALRFLAFALTGVASFLLGCVATVFVMFRVFAPPPNCESPCDGPAYVALGASMFVAPVVGVLFAAGGVYVLSRLWRRKSGAAA
jgi:hypothetical protein